MTGAALCLVRLTVEAVLLGLGACVAVVVLAASVLAAVRRGDLR